MIILGLYLMCIVAMGVSELSCTVGLSVKKGVWMFINWCSLCCFASLCVSCWCFSLCGYSIWCLTKTKSSFYWSLQKLFFSQSFLLSSSHFSLVFEKTVLYYGVFIYYLFVWETPLLVLFKHLMDKVCVVFCALFCFPWNSIWSSTTFRKCLDIIGIDVGLLGEIIKD